MGEAVFQDVVAVDVLYVQSVIAPGEVDGARAGAGRLVVLHVDTRNAPVCLIVYELSSVGVRGYRSD